MDVGLGLAFGTSYGFSKTDSRNSESLKGTSELTSLGSRAQLSSFGTPSADEQVGDSARAAGQKRVASIVESVQQPRGENDKRPTAAGSGIIRISDSIGRAITTSLIQGKAAASVSVKPENSMAASIDPVKVKANEAQESLASSKDRSGAPRSNPPQF